MLEKWLKATITFPECVVPVLVFLSIPEEIIRASVDSEGCRLNHSEKAVAGLIKHSKKLEKNCTRYLRRFDDNFFSNTGQMISTIVTSILVKQIAPLCGNPPSACQAIIILYKLLRIESYRFSDNIKQCLCNDVDLLRSMKIENHILNKYKCQTGMEGYYIANVVKEHFDRNGMSQYFNYFLNFNEEAFEKFCIRVEGRACRNSITSKTLLGEWRPLKTDNYPGGLKIAFRKTEECFEVKAEIFIEVSVGVLSNYIRNPERRKEWDAYMGDLKLIRKTSEQSGLVWYALKKDKKSYAALALECDIVESIDHSIISFKSVSNQEIPCIMGYPRVECLKSYYEIQNLGVKIRRSSSTTDEIESDDDDYGSYQSHHSEIVLEENRVSKLKLFFKMKADMARCFVEDLSEETSIMKESLMTLKRIAENSKKSRVLFVG